MNSRRIRRPDWDQYLMDRLNEANERIKIAIIEINTAENSVQERRLKLESKRDSKLISAGYLRSYALDIVKPIIGYFIAQMTGTLEDIHKGYCAACFFDTCLLKRKIM